MAGKPREWGVIARPDAMFPSERAVSSIVPGPGRDGDELSWSKESSECLRTPTKTVEEERVSGCERREMSGKVDIYIFCVFIKIKYFINYF